jgi:preprotein translocase subunit SecE
VARDRQRSKARQRARAAGEQPPKRRRSRSRDTGLDDASVNEAGLGEISETTPDELEGAFPNVDEAHLAETGASVEREDEEILSEEEYPDDFERGADEVEIPRDLVTDRGGAGGGGGGRPVAEGDAHHEHRDRGRVLTFLRASADELRRVQWPDRKHVFQATAVVLGFVLVAGGWLGLMDAIWQPLINAIL